MAVEVGDQAPDFELRDQHGTLVIDLVDSDTKKMIWRSTVEADKKKLSELGEPHTIQEAVDKAFKEFPPAH